MNVLSVNNEITCRKVRASMRHGEVNICKLSVSIPRKYENAHYAEKTRIVLSWAIPLEYYSNLRLEELHVYLFLSLP